MQMDDYLLLKQNRTSTFESNKGNLICLGKWKTTQAFKVKYRQPECFIQFAEDSF